MKRNLIQNIILLVICVVIAAVYFVDTDRQEKQQEKEKQEKQLISLGKEQVGSITIVKASKTIQAEPTDNGWQLLQPLKAPGDKSNWDTIRTRFTDGERDRVVRENAEDLSVYGLDAPQIAVTIKAATEDTESTIYLGKETPTSGKYYALINGSSDVMTVRSTIFDAVDKEVFDLRDKTVLHVETDKVQKIEITLPDFDTTLERQDEDNWQIASPIRARADKTKVRDLINSVRNSKIQQFVEEEPEMYEPYKLVNPATKVMFWSGNAGDTAGWAAQGLVVGGTSPATAMLYAKREGQKNVFTVKPEDISKVPKSLDELRQKKLSNLRSWEVDRFKVISSSGTVLEASKSSGDWFEVQPTDGKADYTSVSNVLRLITDLEADQFLGGKKEAYGIGNKPLFSFILEKKNVGASTFDSDKVETKSSDISFATTELAVSAIVTMASDKYYVGALEDPLEIFAIPQDKIQGILSAAKNVKLDEPPEPEETPTETAKKETPSTE